MNPVCRSCQPSDARLGHRLSGHSGIPCAVTATPASPASRNSSGSQVCRQAMACGASPAAQACFNRFYGTFFNKRPQGTNFNTAELLPARLLSTTGAGEPARQAASSGLPGCLPVWAVPAPAACRELAGATCQQEHGWHGCDGHCGGCYTWERGMTLRREGVVNKLLYIVITCKEGQCTCPSITVL